MPFVYMLRCRDGSLYTGSAKSVAARLRQHEKGRASRYTRARLPVTLVWWRRVGSWSKALREEYRIKQLRRTDKEALAGAQARILRKGDPLQSRSRTRRKPFVTSAMRTVARVETRSTKSGHRTF